MKQGINLIVYTDEEEVKATAFLRVVEWCKAQVKMTFETSLTGRMVLGKFKVGKFTKSIMFHPFEGTFAFEDQGFRKYDSLFDLRDQVERMVRKPAKKVSYGRHLGPKKDQGPRRPITPDFFLKLLKSSLRRQGRKSA